MNAHPFDALAPSYDDDFTRTAVGRAQRRAVWRLVDDCFPAGGQVLELGCGTGVDAQRLAARGLQVLATDASPGMLAAARFAIEGGPHAARVAFRAFDANRLADPVFLQRGRIDPAVLGLGALGDDDSAFDGETSGDWTGTFALAADEPLRFDGALSNFGVLNCVDDLGAVLRGLALLLHPGADAVVVVMGRFVVSEWLWFGLRGRLRSAVRRLRPGGVPWRDLRIRYVTPGRLRRLARHAGFEVITTRGVGIAVPVSEAAGWMETRPRLMRALAGADRALERLSPAAWMADHVAVRLRRTEKP
ncbi:MAG: methyltransferase [Acidobacteriota bacterium]